MDFTDFLFRYRSYNSKTLEAFSEDKLYFSTPNMFNDPYDSRFYVNTDMFIRTIKYEWETQMEQYLNEKVLKDMPSDMQKVLHSNIMELNRDVDYQKKFFGYVFEIMASLREAMRNNLKVICFSQQYLSTLMWAHYADFHKGFCIMYSKDELQNAKFYDKSGCEIENKVQMMKVNYLKEQPDLGPYLYWYIPIKYFGYKSGALELEKNSELIKKVIISKAKEWEYEDEWRIIPEKFDVSNKDSIAYLKIKPSAIFLGSTMGIKEKKELVDIAKKKNIAIFETYPNMMAGKYEFNFCKANLKQIREEYKHFKS